MSTIHANPSDIFAPNDERVGLAPFCRHGSPVVAADFHAAALVIGRRH
jgi:hypothetical protein